MANHQQADGQVNNLNTMANHRILHRLTTAEQRMVSQQGQVHCHELCSAQGCDSNLTRDFTACETELVRIHQISRQEGHWMAEQVLLHLHVMLVAAKYLAPC